MSQYFVERFNPFSMGFLSLVLGLGCATAVSFVQQTQVSFPHVAGTVAALFLFLLRLRIFDEFKDAKHDRKYHPERPIPRGLVTLRELVVVLVAGSILEVGIAIAAHSLMYFLFAAGYSLLMSKEFFVRDWLREHFSTYIFSHELLMIPLTIYLYSVAGETTTQLFNGNLLIFILSVTSAMFSLELARKFRAPEDESEGRDTYTSQYGKVGASVLLGVTLLVTAIVATFFIRDMMYLLPLGISGVLVLQALLSFIRHPDSRTSKRVFVFTSIYAFCAQFTLITYWITQLYGNHLR